MRHFGFAQWLLAVLVVHMMLFVVASFGSGKYCEDANNDGNAEYPTMDSKCTVVTSDTTGTTISARFLGPQLPAHDPDPVCGSIATTVKCRRICGDLPKGKVPDKVVSTNITPPNFARFDKFEDFNKGDHHTVCYRVKNWANNGGLNGGEYRTFFYKVSYK